MENSPQPSDHVIPFGHSVALEAHVQLIIRHDDPSSLFHSHCFPELGPPSSGTWNTLKPEPSANWAFKEEKIQAIHDCMGTILVSVPQV